MNIIEFTLSMSKITTDPEIISAHFDKFSKQLLGFEEYFRSLYLDVNMFKFATRQRFSDIGITPDNDVIYYRTGLAAEEVIYIEIALSDGSYRFYDGENLITSKDISIIMQAVNKYYLTTLI